jgi:hypothetical protein
MFLGKRKIFFLKKDAQYFYSYMTFPNVEQSLTDFKFSLGAIEVKKEREEGERRGREGERKEKKVLSLHMR